MARTCNPVIRSHMLQAISIEVKVGRRCELNERAEIPSYLTCPFLVPDFRGSDQAFD
jgi:hypothetical protein